MLGNNIVDSPNLNPENKAGYVEEAFILAFPLGLPPDQRLVMTFTAYFDESGTHDESKSIAVAGYISTAPLWVEFSAQWQLALNDWGLDHFHMTDFAVKAPPYDKWTESERRERLTRLITVINSNVWGSVGVVLPKKIFEGIFTPRVSRICGGACGVAAIACIMDLGELLRELKIGGSIAYVFEAGTRGIGEFARVFGSVLKDPENKEYFRLLSLRFEGKQDFLPLQAADLLAYELYRELPRKAGWEQKSVRYPLTALAAVPRRWGYYDEGELRKLFEILSIRAAAEDSGELPPL